MALTQWTDIGVLLLAVFAGIVTLLVLAVHLEQWLGTKTEPPGLAIVPPVNDLDEPGDLGHLGDQGVA